MLADCTVSLSPIYSEPNPQSTMVSQILFGELCEILDRENDFYKIKLSFDGTEGWVSALILNDLEVPPAKNTVTEPCVRYATKSGTHLLSLGSEVTEETDSNFKNENLKENISSLANVLQNIPYVFGGRSVFGCDADGFVQLVFKANAIFLPRQAKDQALLGDVLDFLGESDAGDLAFFENELGQINHVGIMLNNYQVIHCFGKVRIDSLDSSGIYNVDLKKHTHKLRFVKRILN
ncbi:C40 family peptidase [Amniculibacterium aquaticum]|uniref:C40 family peptidase n=1 Tax=Amniculibacterium aquaticum TaxID=2479858 RepID=UPI000F5A562F|nr:NlpC/P60 family protein [Amniculibacterium aquaticum]